MMQRKFTYLMCDFETTVYEGQDSTEVWASACVELFTEDVVIFHSIEETFDYFVKLNKDLVCYYHNLKFDGNFWLAYLLSRKDLTLAADKDTPDPDLVDYHFLPAPRMKNNTYNYTISARGQWYCIRIKIHDKIIEIRDSLKLLPFSVKKIGKDFKCKHQKLEMEYKGKRYAGCEITDSEKEYIANDVLVVKEALEVLFEEGHNKLTIGACCLSEYKHMIGRYDWKLYFKNLEEIPLEKEVFGYDNADAYVRKSYKGGWCYVVPEKTNQIFHEGFTADVNSLYPSMMSSESGNRYPVGTPYFWSGNFFPDRIDQNENIYYFVRIRTRFYLKPDKLPFIQIKDSFYYKGTECLETSDIYDKVSGKYYSHYIDADGNEQIARVTMTLTKTDFILFMEHYDVEDFEVLDGCWFYTEIGLFDEYINKYKEMKLNSTGARKGLAKLFLNNLYGKMATNSDSSFKIAYLDGDGSLKFISEMENNKKVCFIPVGSAITSYARNFTIRAAQANYYGKHKRGFVYADTDSIHCDLPVSAVKGIKIHDKNFCCWKLESQWDVGLFVRQKTYIEHVIGENLEPIEEPYYNIKCAGMPQRSKDLFLLSCFGYQPKEDEKFTEQEREFLKTKRSISDFKIGLTVPGKLRPVTIKGGVILVDCPYQMR